MWPSGIRFDVRADESILAAAFRNGVVWPTRCLGRASCRLCVCEIPDDSDAVSEVSRLEREALSSLVHRPTAGHELRLACQTQLVTDVTVRKTGVRRDQRDDG